MTTDKRYRVCPMERAGALESGIRYLLHAPRKILQPYVRKGMLALDLGCGPGFFTRTLAELVGPEGKVIAADLQEGMLARLRRKIQGTELEQRITTHQCTSDRIGLTAECDFVLVFYMLHEVPDQQVFLREVRTLLKPSGKVLIVEPKFHVSKKDMLRSIRMMEQSGFKVTAEPKVFLSRAVVIERA